jgi:methylphosphotriester-DNA--protein-cysteine methyltransferase
MIQHIVIADEDIQSKIRRKEICFGGNGKLKIYGSLHCVPGKRMKTENRVFFASKKEAVKNGFRPCGHCTNAAHKKWKNEFIW